MRDSSPSTKSSIVGEQRATDSRQCAAPVGSDLAGTEIVIHTRMMVAIFETFDPERARELRRAANLTQGQVARRIGVSISSICYFEQGRMRPRPSVRARYVALLNELRDDILSANDPAATIAQNVDALVSEMVSPQ